MSRDAHGFKQWLGGYNLKLVFWHSWTIYWRVSVDFKGCDLKIFRNTTLHISGQTAAWQSSSAGQVQPKISVQPSAAEPAKKSEPLKSKKIKEAPAPFEDDFPDLGPSQGPSLSEAMSSKGGAKKKNKNKKNGSAGFLIGDEPITAPPAQGTTLLLLEL